MSGPTTVLITGNPAVVLLAAAAIRAAQAVAEARANAQALRQTHADQHEARDQQQRDATEQGRQALRGSADQALGQFEQLSTLATKLGLSEQVRATLPAEPEAHDDDDALAAYVRALNGLNAELRSILLTDSARQALDISGGPDFTEALAAAAAQAQRLSQRLLARLAHLGELPESLRALAHELDQTPPGARAELLATELRAQVQAHAQAVQQRQVQEATALVVEQSLKDLGYQVEEVSHTLFVEGGVVHFRRAGWGQYMVRMRVDATAGSANFNVVRAVVADQNERSVLDHLAEDRWCAEFPTLLKALEARGLRLQVTRRLEAGELPVQQVAAEQLPSFADDDASTTAPTRALNQRRP